GGRHGAERAPRRGDARGRHLYPRRKMLPRLRRRPGVREDLHFEEQDVSRRPRLRVQRVGDLLDELVGAAEEWLPARHAVLCLRADQRVRDRGFFYASRRELGHIEARARRTASKRTVDEYAAD